MRTIYQQYRFKKASPILTLFATILFVGCSGYQSVSYYQDGIYGEAPVQEVPQQAVHTTTAPNQNGTYYKNYFSEKASQGIQDDYLFTHSEQYQTPTPEQNSAGNYQAHGSWGDQTDRININVIYNRPFGWNWGWGWYDAPYSFGRSSFWGFNYHPWYFTFGHQHNAFYNPYRFGWGFYDPYYGPYWNRWGNPNPYSWNSYQNGNFYRNSPIYSSINGGRGEGSLSRSSLRSTNSQGTNTKRAQTNSRSSGSLRNNMRRSRGNNSYYSNSNQRQQREVSTTRSRAARNENSYNSSNNNSYSTDSYNSNSRSNNSFGRTRSSSNSNFSRTSAGSRSATSSSSRSSSSRRR